MNKETWIKHIEGISGLVRPSISNERNAWKAFLDSHCGSCNQCKERRATRQANKQAKEVREVYADIGMKRVMGNLGRVYFE